MQSNLFKLCPLLLTIVSCSAATFGSNSSTSAGSTVASTKATPSSAASDAAPTPTLQVSYATPAPALPPLTPVGSAGQVTVTVADATTKNAIPNATVRLSASGGTAVTGANGQCTLSYTAADGGVTASASGFAPDTQQITAKNGHIYIFLNPYLISNEARMVLTWGQQPQDLDGHLFMQPTGGKIYHVWWANKQIPDAYQDVDTTTGFGPETITITNLVPGHYDYRVADYTDCVDIFEESNSLLSSESGARVRFYLGSSEQEFDVPTGQTGRVWSVFSFDVNASGSLSVAPENTFSDDCSDYTL